MSKETTFDSQSFQSHTREVLVIQQAISFPGHSVSRDNAFANRSRTPWWLWPNLLSLDAPLVATIWMTFLAKIFHAQTNPISTFVLLISVWSIYAMDRLLDGYSCAQTARLRRRHFFASDHRLFLASLIGLSTITSAVLCFIFLPMWQLDTGLVLLLFVVAYLVATHAAPENIKNWLPKELLVGALFAAGTAWPLCGVHDHLIFALMLALFACLCSLNCLAIEHWETAGDLNGAPAQRLDSGGLKRQIEAGTVLLALVAVAAFIVSKNGVGRIGFLSIAGAAISLAVVNIFRNHFTAEQLRVLADVVLVVPAFAGILLLGGGQHWCSVR